MPAPCVQHSIRRVEYDAWLLERFGATFVQHAVRDIRHDDEHYIVDKVCSCRDLIGAAGTSCPVCRTLFSKLMPRTCALQTAALELEFLYDWQDPDCHLWFFEHGLPGYSGYVPKASGWLNVGVGVMAARLRIRGENIREHWADFAAKLERQFRIRMSTEPFGYSYYFRGQLDPVRFGTAFLTGDCAGLATRDLCEGIGSAIRSGQHAAHAILSGTAYTRADLTGASLGGG